MNNTKKLLPLAFALLAQCTLAQSGNQPIRVIIFGDEVRFPNEQPVQSNGRVLVPLRGVFEKLGAIVSWDPDTQTITARTDGTRVKLKVGDLDASVNDRDVHLDVPATLVNGSTMVPLRFVGEAFGANVSWNSFQQEVDITRGEDFDIPRTGDRRQAPPLRQAPPVRTDPPARRPAPPAQEVDLIPEDSVIPLRLDTRLTSYDARIGDPFMATIDSEGHDYLGLPSDTQVSGKVSYAQARRGNQPGLIELEFSSLITPNGRKVAIYGRMTALDSDSVVPGPHGTWMAKSERSSRVVFAGNGSKLGIVVGLRSNGAIADIALGESVRRIARIDEEHVSDVELAPGTRLGLRLYRSIRIRHEQR